jgi:hypothetical protein
LGISEKSPVPLGISKKSPIPSGIHQKSFVPLASKHFLTYSFA